MRNFTFGTIGVMACTLFVTACVSQSPQPGQERMRSLVGVAGIATAGLDAAADDAALSARNRELLAVPLNARTALELSFLNNSRVRTEFAGLGISESEVVTASRLANPVLFASRTQGGGSHISIFSLSTSLTDLILLSTRRHLAAGSYEAAQRTAAAAIVSLAADVEQAWYRYVGSEQIAGMRGLIAQSAETSSELAERYHAAGNISDLDLAIQHRDAAQARIAAARAASDATRSKFDLQQLLGLTGEPAWSATLLLPAPIETSDAVDALLATAHERRGDLAAARQSVATLDDALRLATRWRWLGKVDLGVERDREQDAVRLTGPTIALALPIFNQGQAGVERATGELMQARARVTELETEIDNSVRLHHARVAAARAIATQYSKFLNPAQTDIVARQQERQNFMLIGQFELLLAKEQQYDAYQSYLEAVRDYWLARSDLARAVGGSLPSDSSIPPANIGVASMAAHTGENR